MKHHPSGILALVLLLLAGTTLTACDSNSDDDDGPHNDVAYVQISVGGGGIGYYAASDTTPISPIIVARNAEYEVNVDFVDEDGIPIEYDGYTYQVSIGDAIATWATDFRNGVFYGTVAGVELGETTIEFRLVEGGRAVWTSAEAELLVTE